MKNFKQISAPIRNRLMTPDNAPDYTYVNYHDSSNGRASQSRDDKGQPRSILKNKQVQKFLHLKN